MITLMINVYLDDKTKVVISDNKMKNDETNFDNELKDFI